ncbi:MAG: hypothetical protein HOH04_13710, partial [Rhodospirillaceae bacterium]|nr:hypothetical protein [Rhodospirillaceae bacterium]
DGNDTLIGGTGQDKFVGGDGDDTIKTGDGGDTVVGGAGNDDIDFESGAGFYTLTYRNLDTSIALDLSQASNQVSKGANGTDTLSNYAGISTATGGLQIMDTSGDDVFTGYSSNFTSYRILGGDDTVTGGAGTDRIDYRDATAGVKVTMDASGGGTGTSASTVDAGIGTDTFISGIEQVQTSDYDDIITGGSTSETFRARGGDDTIDGGAGTDWARYSSATSSVIADLGDNNQNMATYIQDGFGGFDTLLNIERLRSGSGDDELRGDSNANYLRAGSGADDLFGRGGNDTLSGEGGNDLLSGGGGADTLDGGSDSDIISGGAGADNLTGGTGSDTFRYRDASHSGVGTGDTITDFSTGEGDKFRLEALSDLAFSSTITTTFAGTVASAKLVGTLLSIDLTGNSVADMEITLSGFSGSLTSANFDWRQEIDGTSGNETYGAGSSGKEVYVATLGTDTMTVDGLDQLLIDGTLFLEGAVLVDQDSDTNFDDLQFDIFDSSDDSFHSMTVVDHLTTGLDRVRFDFQEDGIINTYWVAASLSESANTNDLVSAGTDSADTISTGSGDDILMGNDGDDTLNGGAGDDWFIAGDGDDVINGGANGPAGDTVSFFDAGAAVVIDLTAGTATTGVDSNTLNDIENAEGSDFNDVISGDSGRNVLRGDDGNDTLIGGDGADVLEGGTGSDVFKYVSTALESGLGLGERDQITGFEAGGDGTSPIDQIDLSGFVTTTGGAFSFVGDETQSFTGEASARYNANTKILEIDTDNDQTADMEIELTDVSGTLSDDDFIVGTGGGG